MSLVLISPTVGAKTLYKWVDGAGNVTYQDHPPLPHAESTLEIESKSRAIYKSMDDQGVVTYQDQPLPGAEPMVTPQADKPRPYSIRTLKNHSEPQSPRVMGNPLNRSDPLEPALQIMVRGMLGMLAVVILLIAYRLFFYAKVKGWIGEQLVAMVLRRLNYPALHDIILVCKDGHPTQIDHVARTPGGLLVIETKNYSGKIYGNPHDKTWTVCLAGTRHKMQNPLHQNYRHIQAVKELVPDVPVIGHVLFVGSAQPPDGLAGQASNLSDFVDWAEALRRNSNVSDELVQSAWTELKSQAKSDRISRDAHLASLRARFGSMPDT